MIDRTVKLPQPAEPNIEEVFDAFLGEQAERLKPRTMNSYRSVISLLKSYLNDYGHDSLTGAESAFFEHHYDAEGGEHREFCELFGPEKIVENLGMFLGYFMVRKVMGGQELMRSAGTVTRKLSKWLAEKGYISEEEADLGRERGGQAARDLPKAEKAARILGDACFEPYGGLDISEEDFREFDHFTVVRMEPGKLWLDDDLSESGVTGPVPVPEEATTLLEEGWDISCGLIRIAGTWRITEMGNVYPQ